MISLSLQSWINKCIKEALTNNIFRIDVLGFEFEMGLVETIKDVGQEKGIDVALKYIPNEVFNKQAVSSNQIKFYDVCYLEAKARIDKDLGKFSIELTNFSSSYSQEAPTKSKSIFIKDGQIYKTNKNGEVELITKHWTDLIDYWSVDFDAEDKPGSIFENEWQSFRTKEIDKLELETSRFSYQPDRVYKVMVKVVDIFGIDTTKIIEIKV